MLSAHLQGNLTFRKGSNSSQFVRNLSFKNKKTLYMKKKPGFYTFWDKAVFL